MLRRIAAVIAVSIAGVAPAHGAGPVVVSGPGALNTTYATPVVAVPVGGELTHVNLDLDLHDVVARGSYGSDTEPWCSDPDTGQPVYPLGRCPLFWSRLIGIAETDPVLGLANVVAGRAYEFYCTKHPHMFGYLVALPAI